MPRHPVPAPNNHGYQPDDPIINVPNGYYGPPLDQHRGVKIESVTTGSTGGESLEGAAVAGQYLKRYKNQPQQIVEQVDSDEDVEPVNAPRSPNTRYFRFILVSR